jgi:hypothetical protein
MASAQIPAYEQFWLREYNSLQSEYKDIDLTGVWLDCWIV